MASGRRSEEFTGHPKLGDQLHLMAHKNGALPGDVWVTEIRLRVSSDEGVEHMAVVKAVTEAERLVGFVTAPELDTLVHLVVAKLMNGTMKWREDKPYGT